MKKIISLVLAALMVMAMIPTAFAITQICSMCGSDEFTNHNGIHSFSNAQCQACGHCWACADNDECYCSYCASTNYTNGTQVQYDAEADNDNDGQPDHSEAWTVTVPALLEPGASGDVVAQGTWASNRKLVVTADETVTLENSINANDTKTLDIGFAGIELVGSNTAAVTDTKAVSVADIEDALFGTWSGTFYYDVEMVDEVEMISATFAGHTLTAEKDMTWEEWVGSKYHDKFLEDCGDDAKYIPELSIDSQGYVVADNGLSEDYVYADTTVTKAADKIIIGADYTRGLPEDRD